MQIKANFSSSEYFMTSLSLTFTLQRKLLLKVGFSCKNRLGNLYFSGTLNKVPNPRSKVRYSNPDAPKYNSKNNCWVKMVLQTLLLLLLECHFSCFVAINFPISLTKHSVQTEKKGIFVCVQFCKKNYDLRVLVLNLFSATQWFLWQFSAFLHQKMVEIYCNLVKNERSKHIVLLQSRQQVYH